MKGVWIGLAILLAAAVVFYFFGNKKSVSESPENLVFSVNNVEDITRIVMQNRNGLKVDLQKNDDKWTVNGKPAFNKQVAVFLNETVKKVAIRGPVAENYRNYVITQMASNAVKISIYIGEKIVKTYYVGEADQLHKSTYIYMENSKTPYEGHIPGFDGYLTPRYHVIEEDWYDRILFDYKPEDLKQVEFNYHEKPSESFTMIRKGEDYFLNGEKIQQSKGKSFFALFRYIGFEGYPNYLTQQTQDSIMLQKPMIDIIITENSGNENKLTIWRKGRDTDRTLYDSKGNILAPDAERYFAKSNKIAPLLLIQDYVFGKLFLSKSSFLVD